MNRFGGDDAQKIIQGANFQNDANVTFGQTDNPALLRSIEIDLSVERTLADAMQIKFNFDCLRVASANSDTAIINCQFFRNEENQSFMSMGNKDVANFFKTMNTAILTWPAQPGVFLKLDFYIGINFESGSNLIDIKSQSNAFNMAGLTLQNNELNCILQSVIRGNIIAADEVGTSNILLCKNNPNYNVSGFLVPAGYEFVVTGMEKINKLPVPLVEIGVTFLGCAQVAPGFTPGVFTVGDPALEKVFVTNDSFTDTVYKSPLNSMDDTAIVFPWGLRESGGSPDVLCTVEAGKQVVALLLNDTGAPTILDQSIFINILGFLKRVA